LAIRCAAQRAEYRGGRGIAHSCQREHPRAFSMIPFTATGRVVLPEGVEGPLVLDCIRSGLTERLHSVDYANGRVRFTVGWTEFQNRTWNWIYAVDQGTFDIVSRLGATEVQYNLRLWRVPLIAVIVLVAGFGVTSMEFMTQLIFIAGAWIVLVGANYSLAAVGVRDFVKSRATQVV
jgi:hypothetical protein